MFTEAHNVESSCERSASFDLTALGQLGFYSFATNVEFIPLMSIVWMPLLDCRYCANACSQPQWIAPPNVTMDTAHIVSGALTLKEAFLCLESAIGRFDLPSDRSKVM